MNKKNIKITYIIAFCLLIALPLIQLNTKLFPVKALEEKRKKAESPTFASSENMKKFTADFDAYYKDNFGFRESLIRLSNNLDLKVFKKSPNDSVLLGKNDYLFLKEELKDYDRTNLLTDEQINVIATNIKNFQESLKERGVEFLFSIAPNKSTIYPEFVGRPSKNPNLESNEIRLSKALKEKNVRYLDFKALMLDNKDKYDLYYKRDTHWNNIACALAADSMLKELGPKFGVDGSIVFSKPYTYKRLGDLDVLLGINSGVDEYTTDIKILPPSKQLPKAILYHDSFSYDVLPLLDKFSSQRIALHNLNTKVHATFPVYYNNAKIVYFEMVERYIGELLTYSFDMFDNETTDLDAKYTPVTIELDKNKNTNLKLKDAVSETLEDKSYTYFSSTSNTGSISLDIDKQNIDYLYLELDHIDDYTKTKISWAKSGEEFTDKDSIAMEFVPIKKKYVIPIKGKDITKLRINIDINPNKELNIKTLKLY